MGWWVPRRQHSTDRHVSSVWDGCAGSGAPRWPVPACYHAYMHAMAVSRQIGSEPCQPTRMLQGLQDRSYFMPSHVFQACSRGGRRAA